MLRPRLAHRLRLVGAFRDAVPMHNRLPGSGPARAECLPSRLFPHESARQHGRQPAARSATHHAWLGLRRDLNHSGKLRLLRMGSRSVHRVVSGNGKPDWIAVAGLQMEIERNKPDAQ